MLLSQVSKSPKVPFFVSCELPVFSYDHSPQHTHISLLLWFFVEEPVSAGHLCSAILESLVFSALHPPCPLLESYITHVACIMFLFIVLEEISSSWTTWDRPVNPVWPTTHSSELSKPSKEGGNWWASPDGGHHCRTALPSACLAALWSSCKDLCSCLILVRPSSLPQSSRPTPSSTQEIPLVPMK